MCPLELDALCFSHPGSVPHRRDYAWYMLGPMRIRDCNKTTDVRTRVAQVSLRAHSSTLRERVVYSPFTLVFSLSLVSFFLYIHIYVYVCTLYLPLCYRYYNTSAAIALNRRAASAWVPILVIPLFGNHSEIGRDSTHLLYFLFIWWWRSLCSPYSWHFHTFTRAWNVNFSKKNHDLRIICRWSIIMYIYIYS